MSRPYLGIIFALTLLIAGGMYWFNSPAPESAIGEWQEALPKTYLVNAKTSNFNEEGALTDVLAAQSAEMYPSKKETLLESPRMYTHNLNEDTWTASSDMGRYDHRREVLTLTENVVLSNDINHVTLKTEQMKIDLRRNTALSRVPVTISDGLNSTTADGMRVDMDSQTVKLQPNVESIYVKPSL
ncbi:MAG: LPS export ABC transporter periplasmic protein LptC [Halioglobus sp.]